MESNERMTLGADLERLAPLVGTRRGWWLREALAADAGAPCPPLRGSAEADVVIVGGGFTGLWTAWNLIEQAPGIRVTILEADIVGGGASGRNGGFLTGLWETLPSLVRHFGEAAAVATALEAERAPGEIRAWCERHAVDAWFVPGGTLAVPSSPAQDGAFDGAAALATRLGYGDRFIALSTAEVLRRTGGPHLRAGYLVPGDANIQPARLARGLRRVLLERGVTIHEETRVGRLRAGSAVRVETGAGEIRADRVVLALNAWAAGWPGFGSRLVTWSSYMVMTEPIPDRLAEIGWTGGEAISDGRFTNHYFRTTADGRIAFGGGGGRAGFGGRMGDWVTRDLGSVRLAARGFRRLYPQLHDVALEDAWGGPIDIAPNHLPTFGTLPGGNVHYGHGYSGTGVGPATSAGGSSRRWRSRGRTAGGRTGGRLVPPPPARRVPAATVPAGAVPLRRRAGHPRGDRAQGAGRRPRPAPLADPPGARADPPLMGYDLGPE